MKSKTPRLCFADFGPYGEWEGGYIYALRKLLSESFDVVISCNDPEYLIYSGFGQDHYKYRCPKVFFTGENVFPNFHECDWAFSSDPSGGKNFYLPTWAILPLEQHKLAEPTADPTSELSLKKHFCAFVNSNPACKTRNQFFKVLSERKHVDSAGKLFRNTDVLQRKESAGTFYSLPSFYRNYKFVISFENMSAPGYTTEKIITAFLGNTVPIYWGNPDMAGQFNPRSYISAHDFDSLEELADHVIKVDHDDELYLGYLKEPKFSGGKIPECADKEIISAYFKTIFSTKVRPVAKSRFMNRSVLPNLPTYVTRQIRRHNKKALLRPAKRMTNPTRQAVSCAETGPKNELSL